MIITVQWLWLATVKIATFLIGLPVVAVAVFFPVDGSSVSDGRPIVNLHKWAWLWGNDFDGLDGDGRGWWAANTPFGWPVTSRRARWWWAAIRNPANNLRRIAYFSCPVSKCVTTFKGQAEVEDSPGKGGWQLVTASDGTNEWYGFYLVKELTPTRAFVVRAGFKIKPSHGGTDEPDKGFTFKINPWKAI